MSKSMLALAGSKLLSIRRVLRKYLMKTLRYYPSGSVILQMVGPRFRIIEQALPLKVLQALTRGRAVYSRSNSCPQSHQTSRKNLLRLLWTYQSPKWASLQSQSLIKESHHSTTNTLKSWLRARLKMRVNSRSVPFCYAALGSNLRTLSPILPTSSKL